MIFDNARTGVLNFLSVKRQKDQKMSQATQTETQTQTLEETLNKTDLGHILYENRKIFFGMIIVILVGGTGLSLWKQSQKSSALEHSEKVFEFQSGLWDDAKTGKATAETLVKEFVGLDEKVRTAPIMIPLALEISKFLVEKQNYAEADKILAAVQIEKKAPVSHFFIALQRSVILEKLGKIDEAIAVLSPLAESKDGIMPAKVSLELGRLYAQKGEKGKAQTQFDYVISNFPNDDLSKMAKLYLQQLAQ